MTWIFGSAFAKFLIWLLLSAGDGDFIACSCFVKSAFDNSLWDILIKAMFKVSYLKEKEELNMYKQQDTFLHKTDSENHKNVILKIGMNIVLISLDGVFLSACYFSCTRTFSGFVQVLQSFWWKTYTKRCTKNYVISRVKRLSSPALCGWWEVFNFRVWLRKRKNAV